MWQYLHGRARHFEHGPELFPKLINLSLNDVLDLGDPAGLGLGLLTVVGVAVLDDLGEVGDTATVPGEDLFTHVSIDL